MVKSLDYDTFVFFRDIMERASGISLPDHKFHLVENRLRKRLRELNLLSFKQYLEYINQLEDDSSEVWVIVNYLTTNVTHFFRNTLQLKVFETRVVDDLVNKSGGRTIRFWSAGCASGEEPYTLALILFEKNVTNFEILASDINTHVLNTAAGGIYDHNRIAGTPKHLVEKYFKPTSDGYEVRQFVKDKIRFKKINLLWDLFSEKFDCIFCRNVLIYFKKEDKDKIVFKFYTSMEDQSYLFLGHSESLVFDNRFYYKMASIYQKRHDT